MKKKKVLIVIGIILVIGIIVALVLLNNIASIVIPIRINNDFKLVSLVDGKEVSKDDRIIISSYNQYREYFNSNNLKEKDFKDNNYALIVVTYSGCLEYDVTPTKYNIKGNTINIEVKYKVACGFCAPEYDYYLLKIDKSMTSFDYEINYQAVNKVKCDQNVDYKPLIYIYTLEEIDVTVKLGYPERLTTTYPKYNNEWKVKAYPNGDLKDDKNIYYGLYWEGIDSLDPQFEDGFLVRGVDSASFLEEKLSILGLNDRERDEFIIYWLPKLEANKYNLIRFESLDLINKNMPLDIDPNPDTLIRVLMEYKASDKFVSIKEQKLTTPVRQGYTVVEWGGTEIK